MNRQILRIAIPSIVSNITVPLLGLVDLWISGHLGATAFIGAIAIGSMMFNMLYWLCGFLRMSTGGFTAQAYGRHDFATAHRVLRRTLTVSLVIALCFIVLQEPLLRLSLRLMNATPAVSPFVTTYFRILIYGAPAVLANYVLTGWFIGMQNAKVPMVASLTQNVVNIAVSLLLTQVWHCQLAGVAAGTLVAQWSGIAVYAIALFRLRHRFSSDTSSAPADSGDEGLSWGRFFRVNRDIFLRTLCLVAVNVATTAAGALQGDLTLAVNALLLQFYTLFSYIIDGFAYAGEALGGRYYGAGDARSFRILTRRLFLFGGALTLAYSLVYVIGGTPFLRLLTNEESVVRAATSYLPYACLIPLASFAGFLYDGLYIGTTATRQMLVTVLAAAVTFFLLRYTLLPCMGNDGLWLAFLAFLCMRGVMQTFLYKSIRP